MNSKYDIRFILYQVYNIHLLVYDSFNNHNFHDAYLLLQYELKKYQYLKDNLELRIKISSYYLEYSTSIDNKLDDIKKALVFIKKKIKKCPIKLSNNTQLKLDYLMLNNLFFYFKSPSSLSNKNRKTIFYIIVYLSKKIKLQNKDYSLIKNNKLPLTYFCPFKAQ